MKFGFKIVTFIFAFTILIVLYCLYSLAVVALADFCTTVLKLFI